MQGSIVSHIYGNVLTLYEKYEDSGLRGRLLQCLGTHYPILRVAFRYVFSFFAI